jgi:hypothetical protein
VVCIGNDITSMPNATTNAKSNISQT